MYLKKLNHEKLFSRKVSACHASLIRLEGLLRVRVIHMLRQNYQLLPQISSERLQRLPMAKKGVKGTLTMLSLHNDKINSSYLHCLISLSIWVNKNLYSRQHLEYIRASLKDA